MPGTQKPLELILARNLLTSLSTPAMLLDEHATLIYYNEATGALLGIPFEEAGRLGPTEWIARFGPFDDDGEPIPIDELPLTHAINDGRPGHANFTIRAHDGDHRIAASAMPIVGSGGASGAIVIFWPLDTEKAKAVIAGELSG